MAQQQVYKNYTSKDGLPGSTVYTAMQDRKGFLWFGTDHGLSRFDGTNFVNFTVRDGLPDNDVFIIAEDSLERLWMICYNSTPCFMYKGIIHNAENDTLLSGMKVCEMWFSNITVDEKGKVWIYGDRVYVIDSNKIMDFEAPGGKRCSGIGYIGNRPTITVTGGIYYINFINKKVSYQKIIDLDDGFHHTPCFWNDTCYVTENISKGPNRIIKITKNTVLIEDVEKYGFDNIIENYTNVFGDSLLLISVRNDGVKAFNSKLKLMPPPFPFLPTNTTYTHTCIDREGNNWTTSLGRGVFLSTSNKIIQYNVNTNLKSSEVTALYKNNNSVILGLDNAQYEILKGDKTEIINVNNNSAAGKKIIKICDFNRNLLSVATDYGLLFISKKNPELHTLIQTFCIKNITHEAEDSCLIAATNGAYRVYLKNGNYLIDTICKFRTTSVEKDKHGCIWLASLNGLYTYKSGRIESYNENNILNKSRITDMAADSRGNLWLATHQRGVFIITDNNEILNINETNGLPSDICKRIFKEREDVIWVCANHSAAKISVTSYLPLTYNVTVLNGFNIGQGLQVNDIYTDDKNIWLGTSDGAFNIPAATHNTSFSPPVYITSFKYADSSFTNFNVLHLKHYQNNIEIGFIGISYNSAGKVLYKYVLNSNNADTVSTYNNVLSFYALPAGKYIFNVWARSPDGLWSNKPATILFEIHLPFWKTWWFAALIMIAIIIIIWSAAYWRINLIRRREKANTAINKKIAEIELQALRAHMNEHFIFNSLSSIQNYINRNDVDSANFYLANFGALIRQTMEISATPVISLKEELEYLNNYLTLEKMRFGKKFNYLLTNNISSFSAEDIIFPSMVLQPYVENAIRHGLRHKTEGQGLLEISFICENGFIVCHVRDNGVGRKAAAELKSKMHIEYRSKGIKLSEDKVFLFNRVNNSKIRVEIEDLINEQGKALGTLVKVFVPLKDAI